jgi:outer membrane receptor protein involved in Fe transport
MQRDGFVDIVGGEIDAINDRDRWGARFQALYTPNDDVTDAFIVTAGLRWTREEKDMTNTFTQDASPSPPPPPPFDPGWGFWIFPPLPPRSDVDEDIDDDQVTGTFKLSWLMNDLTMFYASYGTGYKSGGINTDRISVTIDVAFDAEKSKSYEMGMKADITAFAYAEAIYTDERMTDVNNDPENTTETLPWSTCAPAWSSSNTQPV